MGITLDSFVDWNQFIPGPQFLTGGSVSTRPFGWASQIRPGAETRLKTAVPSVLDKPLAEEWKTDISSIEWKSLGAIWSTTAESILATDPVFDIFRQAKCVTPNGQWTDSFRSNPAFETLKTEVVVRMEEEFEFYRKFVGAVYSGAPRLATERGERQDDGETPDDSVTVLGWGWLKTAYRVGRIGTLFSPYGVGWIAAEYGAKFAWNRYRDYRQQQERVRQREARRERINQRRGNRARAFDEVEIALEQEFGPSTLEQVSGFVPSEVNAGLFVVEGDAAPFRWTTQLGAPTALTSRVGYYI